VLISRPQSTVSFARESVLQTNPSYVPGVTLEWGEILGSRHCSGK